MSLVQEYIQKFGEYLEQEENYYDEHMDFNVAKISSLRQEDPQSVRTRLQKQKAKDLEDIFEQDKEQKYLRD